MRKTSVRIGNEVMVRVDDISCRTGIPQSRIVERALLEHMNALETGKKLWRTTKIRKRDWKGLNDTERETRPLATA